MFCGIEAINDLRAAVATPPSTPAVLLPAPSPGCGGSRSSQHDYLALNQRMSQGICFRCRQPGHWRENCPLKWGAPEKPPPPSPNLPIVRCHCGRICSKTVIAAKEVYRCPTPNMESKCSVKIPAEEVKTIMCPCGSGAAALNVRITVKFGDIKFYACRLKKGLGACGFVELENLRNRENKEIMTLVLGRVKGQLSPEDCKGVGISCPAKLFEVESSGPDSSRDLVLLEAEHSNPNLEEEATGISRLLSTSEIHHRQMEFDNQISAAAMESSTLRGRLAFPLSRCMPEYLPKHVFCLGSSSYVVQHVPTRAELDWVTPGSSGSIAPANGFSNPKRPFSATEEDQSMVRILGEKLQKELATILQSLEQLQLHLSKNALKVLIQQINLDGNILQAQASSLMRDDTESFHNSQAKFRSAISQLEVQSRVEKCSSFPHESYNVDDSWLDGVCSIYNHTMAAFSASDEQLKTVSQHVFTMRETLLRISSQVQACQAEILKLDTYAIETYSKMAQARTTMMTASENLFRRITNSYQQRNGQHHSSVLPAARVGLNPNTSDMVREGKRQKQEASSKFVFR